MLLVLRELLCGSRQFNEIHRGVPKIPSSSEPAWTLGVAWISYPFSAY